MQNPYDGLPDYAFWRRAVSKRAEFFDPVIAVPFKIEPLDRVAPVGSCFAQHIARTLSCEGFRSIITETGPGTTGASDENFGVFPARFGNIYTIRQMLQLFDRAYGRFEPQDRVWTTKDGALVDPFRPQIQAGGFASVELLNEDRRHHLAAVRAMFETCDVFIFTLGLTEAWLSLEDGAVFPTAPGVVGFGAGRYAFVNFSVAEMAKDMAQLIENMRSLNQGVRFILTVSPVSMIATYEPQHVLVSTVFSKSALRVVAEMSVRGAKDVAYFPSYEMIVGPQAGHRFYKDDLREVTPEGVSYVMALFKRHYLARSREELLQNDDYGGLSAADYNRLAEEAEVVCDEEILDSTVHF